MVVACTQTRYGLITTQTTIGVENLVFHQVPIDTLNFSLYVYNPFIPLQL